MLTILKEWREKFKKPKAEILPTPTNPTTIPSVYSGNSVAIPDVSYIRYKSSLMKDYCDRYKSNNRNTENTMFNVVVKMTNLNHFLNSFDFIIYDSPERIDYLLMEGIADLGPMKRIDEYTIVGSARSGIVNWCGAKVTDEIRTIYNVIERKFLLNGNNIAKGYSFDYDDYIKSIMGKDALVCVDITMVDDMTPVSEDTIDLDNLFVSVACNHNSYEKIKYAINPVELIDVKQTEYIIFTVSFTNLMNIRSVYDQLGYDTDCIDNIIKLAGGIKFTKEEEKETNGISCVS